MSRGYIFTVTGNAVEEAGQAIAQLKRVTRLPITVIGDCEIPGADWIKADDQSSKARWLKVNLEQLTPYDLTIYLDADTRCWQNIDHLFDVLADGYDLAIAPSYWQEKGSLQHLDEQDREHTKLYLNTFSWLNFQAGVFAFNRQTCKPFFSEWRKQWQVFRRLDQGAFMRALRDYPIRLWLLSSMYNSKSPEIVQHLFGGIKI